MFHLTEPARSGLPRWAVLGVAGLLLFGCSSEDDDAADEAATDEAATDEAATDEAATDDGTDEAAADEGAADEGAAEGSAVEIVSVSEAFSPASLTVAAGTEVTWTNADGVDHTVTADDDSFDSAALSGGDTFSFTMADPGTYSYFCAIHPSMTGEIVVE